MKFITDNYILILLIGLFFAFSLIGYLIDTLRKPKKEDVVIPEDIKKIKELKLNDKLKMNEKNNEKEDKESKPPEKDLLTDYDDKVNSSVKKDE